MHLFFARHRPNKFDSALDLSKTFIFMHLFFARHSPNKFDSALGLSKTFILQYRQTETDVGDIPYCFLNAVEKWEGFLNPTSAETSTIRVPSSFSRA